MSLSAKREALARIHGRYQRAGRPYKTCILDEFCATCGYHRKAALRLLRRSLPGRAAQTQWPKNHLRSGAGASDAQGHLAGQQPVVQPVAEGGPARMAGTSRAALSAAVRSFEEDFGDQSCAD